MYNMSLRRTDEKERVAYPSQKYLKIYTRQNHYVTK